MALLTHPNSLGFPKTYTNHLIALLLTPLDINRCGDFLGGNQKGQKIIERLIYMETILEIVRIEQIIREAVEGRYYIIRSLEDGTKIAYRFIVRDDREVFNSAILNNAASVIVAHQHPSGDIFDAIDGR